MRLATWNVNSIRPRVDRVVDVLHRQDIDVLAIQETKCRDDQFPADRFERAGYECAHHGLSQWNGVAILSRVGLEDVEADFPSQPGFAKDADAEQTREARHIAATCGGVRVHSLYIPNGREPDDRHYTYKLEFLAALQEACTRWLDDDGALAAALVGDFNIAPEDGDVWDIGFFEGKTHVSAPEREAFAALGVAGFTDVTRRFTEGAYTYWDYQAARFRRGEGMRIDFQLASPALAGTAAGCFIDVDERRGKGASDHVPVIVDYEIG